LGFYLSEADLIQISAQHFAKDVLNHMRNRLVKYQEQYGALFDLEATPAASTTYRLAKHDVKRYLGIITAAKPGDTSYYTNSSHLPVGATDDLFEALGVQDELQVLYTSGTVFHAYLGEKLPDWKAASLLVRKVAENFKLPDYTISPTYSVCRTHGYISGEHPICPECGEEAEVYSRITGYHRPVKNWNDGKAQGFKDRKLYHAGDSGLQTGDCSPAQIQELLLFTTPTCANCAMTKKALAEDGIVYHVIDASECQDLVEN
jgi:anaerobic ribonucleoside-triphosphate reductase